MRNNIGQLVLLIFTICSLSGCKKVNTEFQQQAQQADFINRSVKKLTDVIVHDIYSPPVASRIYAYPSIAAYEALVNAHPEYKSFEGQLKGLQNVPKPEADLEYCFPLSSVYAYLTVGKTLISSQQKITSFENVILKEFKDLEMPSAVYNRSIEYGQKISDHIITWLDKDNYRETRSMPKYTIPDDPTKWQPTPPSYMDGIEPHWNKIRTFVLDSATQFVPPPPTPYSLDKNSQFYKELMEVYNALDKDVEDRVAIASFWDCNPYVSHQVGHVMYATKKITPGGHWIGITSLATKKINADMMQTMEAHARVSIALADAFISCWDEKYRSNLIRPETVINEHLDEDWAPKLQTPPFPEYTSGHSVISRAAAITLTDLIGDNFQFVDSTEVEYGLPPRSFKSFIHASEEAAVSRLYGGIHYRPAIDYGVEQGDKVGKFINQKIKTKK